MTNDKEQAAAAARALGSIKTEKKAASSRANLTNTPTHNPVPIEQIPCTCASTDGKHKWNCKRRQTQYYRERRERLKKG